MEKSKEYLEELMYYINTVHLDMGGNHRYTLNPKSFSLITEIKAWLYNEKTKEPE